MGKDISDLIFPYASIRNIEQTMKVQIQRVGYKNVQEYGSKEIKREASICCLPFSSLLFHVGKK